MQAGKPNYEIQNSENNRQVARWLLLGVLMILVQFVLGSITRLTESGLSITEWKPITGALPPLNHDEWLREFDRYKNTDQFKYVHQSFGLADFKHIFFWEWIHRLWARLMGLVFAVGFIYFLLKRKFRRSMVVPMAILFLLGGMQGAIGWLMVKSGLVPEKYFVGHIELTTHFVAAMVLLVYTLWFSLKLMPGFQAHLENKPLSGFASVLLILFFVQLIYGGFMAGLHAAVAAPTWPDINGRFAPVGMHELRPWRTNLTDNPLMVHFIHRSLAYIILALSAVFCLRGKKQIGEQTYLRYNRTFVLLVCLQVLLGICTVLVSTHRSGLLVLGVLHQLIGIAAVLCLVVLKYLLKVDRDAGVSG